MGGFGGNGGIGALGAQEDSNRPSRKVQWTPWVRVGGYYNDQINYVNNSGNLINATDSKGANAGWGITASKAIEKTAFFGGYMGSAILLQEGSGVNGSSHMLAAGVNHRVNQNLYVGAQQMIGSSLGGYGMGSGFAGLGMGFSGLLQSQQPATGGLQGFGDPSLNGFVDQEVFDNRVKFSGTVGTASYRLNLRSSISASGGAFFARRTVASLIDNNSYYGSGIYSYALNRTTEIGAGYSIGYITYPGRFGGNYYQTLGVMIGKRFRSRGAVYGSAGLSKFNSNFIGLVPVDPDLAQSLGISATTQAQSARRLTFTGNLSANYNAEVVNLNFHAARGMVPGNGVLYGAVRDVIGFSVGRTFFTNKLNTALAGNISRLSGLIQNEVQTGYQTYASVGYNMYKGMSVYVAGGLRWQRLSQSNSFVPSRFVSVGLGWSPGERPFFF